MEYKLLNYQDLLKEIEGCENHLLLGNGFNRGLGIDTCYKAIFEKMIANSNGVYNDIYDKVIECGFDLEILIDILMKDIAPENLFLRKYVTNKVKLDFMKATHEIVRKELKNVYAEKNEGIYILLSQFTNYFTLNYDPFLYMLLLKFKSTTKSLDLTFQSAIQFKEDDVNVNHHNIVSEIRNIRNGSLSINVSSSLNPTKASLDKVSKSTFTTIIKQYSKSNNKNWKGKIIEESVNLILEEEKQKMVLSRIDDGAKLLFNVEPKEFVFDATSKTQNLFFLHGAFHIYQDGKSIKKITQSGEKALYERLEKILEDENQSLITVFQSKNKLDAINSNDYLKNCYSKLKILKGNILILGSALSDNDEHIFSHINKSQIENIFLVTTKLNEEKVAIANKFFPDKNIIFIDAYTITYEVPAEQAVLQ